MADRALVVGQEFPDAKSFRNVVKEAAIAQHFELRTIKSDLVRYFAKCAAEGCPWRIRAVKVPDAPTFTIRSLDPNHTCGRNALHGHHQASVDWIVSIIEDRLRGDINYKPKDILRDIQRRYGITIPYKQAWRAKERGLAAIYGSSEEGYFLLPSYCDQLKKSNPGSVAEVYTSHGDSRFQRLFVAFYASIYGFLNGCLPAVGLGGIQLKSKYLGTLLSATSFDPDGGMFPLAFGVVDVENDESWSWFLSELRKALEVNSKNVPRITFLTYGQKGIDDSLKREFPGCFHKYCMRYLTESIGREFKNNRLVNLLWKAAYSTSTVAFRGRMTELEEVSPEAAKWLSQFDSSRWAVAYTTGTCYSHLSSNFGEFNKWIVEAQELSIIQVIEKIHSKLMVEFEARRLMGNSWLDVLVPGAEKRMRESINFAPTYKVLQSNEVEFEVVSSETSHIVNIGDRSCSCRDWQIHGIPCSHAVAAILSSQKDVYAFTEKCFTVASYRKVYSEEIHPIPRKIKWRSTDVEAAAEDEDTRIVRPPKVRRPPGRPEKKRVCLEDLNREKHTVHCSRCNQTGHYKTTCKAETMKSIEQC